MNKSLWAYKLHHTKGPSYTATFGLRKYIVYKNSIDCLYYWRMFNDMRVRVYDSAADKHYVPCSNPNAVMDLIEAKNHVR